MAIPVVKPRVRETSTITGTGDIVLGGEMRGSIAFSDVLVAGDTCDICISYDNSFEECEAVFQTGPDRLVRGDVYLSRHANDVVDTNHVSFAGGVKTVIMVVGSGRVTSSLFPGTEIQTTNFSITSSELNRTFLVDTTSAAVEATLPTLAATDAGWECSFIKTNTGTNGLFIKPASGTIQSGDISGLARTRRCIPGARSRVIWTGTAWIAERAVNTPVGTILDCPRSGLPVGYEWASGQTLASASTNYPDFFSANGNSAVVTDRQGRAGFGRTNMDGTDNGLITNALSGIVGTTLGATGGTQTHVLEVWELPDLDLDVDIPSGQGEHNHGGSTTAPVSQSQGAAGGGNFLVAGTASITVNNNTLPQMGGTAFLDGDYAPHQNMPPAIITNFIVVVE